MQQPSWPCGASRATGTPLLRICLPPRQLPCPDLWLYPWQLLRSFCLSGQRPSCRRARRDPRHPLHHTASPARGELRSPPDPVKSRGSPSPGDRVGPRAMQCSAPRRPRGISAWGAALTLWTSWGMQRRSRSPRRRCRPSSPWSPPCRKPHPRPGDTAARPVVQRHRARVIPQLWSGSSSLRAGAVLPLRSCSGHWAGRWRIHLRPTKEQRWVATPPSASVSWSTGRTRGAAATPAPTIAGLAGRRSARLGGWLTSWTRCRQMPPPSPSRRSSPRSLQ